MRALVAFALLAACLSAQAAEVRVAVAANFIAPMQKIAAEFAAETGHRAVLASGSTGAFAAQVRNAAPFEVLLAADHATPEALEKAGFGVPGSRFTYATGRLVLWSAQPGVVDAEGAVLRQGRIERIAIANPKLAPYGAAAIQAMTRAGVLAALQPRIVQGENIAQAYQFAASGAAQAGFVALSQVMEGGRIARGSGWIVPSSMHEPIRQDALLLARGKDNPAAAALLAFMRGDKARAIILAHGYEL